MLRVTGGAMGGIAAGTELPSCPVCLERLDEYISGIVTTVNCVQF
jgi:BRCA1-associated protein